MNARVLPTGRELGWWGSYRLDGHPKRCLLQDLPTHSLNWCFPSFPGVRIIRPSPEESESVGLRWECLFLVNASCDFDHEGNLGNPTESSHRSYCLYRRTSLSCVAKQYHLSFLKMSWPVILSEPPLSSI